MNNPLDISHYITFRAPQLEDIDQIVELINADAEQYLGLTAVTRSTIEQQWASPTFDPANDAWVAIANGKLIGYLHLIERPPYTNFRLWGRIHPDWWSSGVLTQLLQSAENRALSLLSKAPDGKQVAIYDQVLHASHQLLPKTLTDEGYAVVRTFWQMIIDLPAPAVPVELPANVTWRHGSLENAEEESHLINELANHIFRDHWGWNPIPFPVWQAAIAGIPDNYDPTLWFLAEADAEIVGFAVCNPILASMPDIGIRPDAGYLNIMGVRRDWRKHGIATALLHTLFAEFYKRGQRAVILGVDADSPSNAPAVYLAAGMRKELQLDMYKKVIRDGEPPENERL